MTQISPASPLANKTILITGAAQRIGAQLSEVLHQNGANIALHYRSSRDAALALQNKLNEIRSNSAIIIQTDLHDINKLPSMVKQTELAWGRLDALINNASSFYPTKIGEINEQTWDELIGSNLKAAFFLSQAAAPLLAEQHGCIINIVDIHSQRPLKNYPVYSIAKAGLAMMTQSLAAELGPHVRVNGVSPGAILWPSSQMDDVTKQRIISRTLLKQRGSPTDIAAAVRFLLCDAPYITGQILNVDGGRSLNM